MRTSSFGLTVVLEGLPASGKTTLADHLAVHDGFVKVNESLGVLGGAHLSDDQRVIFDDTLAKYAKAREMMRNAVIDRGYLSMLAWDYCAEQLGHAHDLKEKMEWVSGALSDGRLFEPDLYVFLKVTPKTSLQRRPREVISNDVWSGPEGMRLYDEYCVEYFKGYSGPVIMFPQGTTTRDAVRGIHERLASLRK